MKPQLPGGLPHFEKGYYESLIIVLDTLEQCLALQAQESNHKHRGANSARIGHGEDNVVTSSASSGSTSKHDEGKNLKKWLKSVSRGIPE